MSRIGKRIILLPKNTSLSLSEASSSTVVVVKGPKGTLERQLSSKLSIEQSGTEVKVVPRFSGSLSQEVKSIWGLTRTIVQNMVTGSSTGFTKDLEFNGVGYRASVTGNTLTLNLGYSHQIDLTVPEGLAVRVNKNTISVDGCDRDTIGVFCAKIRASRPPEPYKGKGIRYSSETIIRKAGKTGAKK